MNVFDEVSQKAMVNFSDWIKVNDAQNPWTIESFAKAGYDEAKLKPHCVTCSIVNQCWFKNEEGKKPEEFDYSKYPEIPFSKRGLCHPNCHDEKIPIYPPVPDDISIFDLARRMDYLFEDKKEWLKNMGYNKEDINEVFKLIEKNSIESYCSGNYQNNPPEESKKKYGFRIRITLPFPGKREKLGKTYMIISSYIVYPDGKLKNNTPIGGWEK